MLDTAMACFLSVPATAVPKVSWGGSSNDIVTTRARNDKNELETHGMITFENGRIRKDADTSGKVNPENGIHEVGGSIPPGSTRFSKGLRGNFLLLSSRKM